MVIFVEAVDHDTVVAIHVLEGVAGYPHKLIDVGTACRCKAQCKGGAPKTEINGERERARERERERARESERASEMEREGGGKGAGGRQRDRARARARARSCLHTFKNTNMHTFLHACMVTCIDTYNTWLHA